MSLVPCPVCGRHVRSSEKACAFCAAELARPKRGVALALAIATATAAIGCDNAQREIAAPYGAPIVPGDPRDAATAPPPSAPDAGIDPNPGGDVYGGPPPAPSTPKK